MWTSNSSPLRACIRTCRSSSGRRGGDALMWDELDPRSDETRDREAFDPRHTESVDPRDVFTRDLDLPRGLERKRVHSRDRDYDLRGSEVRTLATVGAF